MIDAKQSFLSQVRKRAAEELTAADMERLMVILSDTMEGFRVEELKADGWTANDDDLIASFVSSLSFGNRFTGFCCGNINSGRLKQCASETLIF